MNRKFPALHVISSVFRILSWIVGLFTVLLIILTLMGIEGVQQFAVLNRFVAAAMILLIGGIYALLLHAGGEMIMVWLAIEENTRKRD